MGTHALRKALKVALGESLDATLVEEDIAHRAETTPPGPGRVALVEAARDAAQTARDAVKAAGE